LPFVQRQNKIPLASLEDFINDLENAQQPTCNMDNPADCDSCGS
jgi:hypothetical protein